MCKSATIFPKLVRPIDSAKFSVHEYRRKLALKIKESLENDPITDEDFVLLNSTFDSKLTISKSERRP